MRDFLVSLQSTLDSPPHFAKFISLPANRVFWRQLGVDSRALEAAADGRNLNFGGENGRQLWEKTFAAAQAAAASTRDAAIRQLLVRGLDQLLETYHKELAKDGSLAAGPAVVTIAAGLPPTDPSPVTQDDLLGPCRILINRHPLLTPQTNALCQGLLVLSPAESDCWLELTPGVAGSQACAALVDLRVGLLAQSVNRSLLALAEEVRGLLAQRANPPAGGPSDEDLLRGARTVVLQKCRQIEGWVRTFPGKLCDDLRKLGATNIVVQAMPHFLAPDDATVTLPLSISAASPTDRRERAETRFEAFQ
jgi:hypothetical protein